MHVIMLTSAVLIKGYANELWHKRQLCKYADCGKF